MTTRKSELDKLFDALGLSDEAMRELRKRAIDRANMMSGEWEKLEGAMKTLQSLTERRAGRPLQRVTEEQLDLWHKLAAFSFERRETGKRSTVRTALKETEFVRAAAKQFSVSPDVVTAEWRKMLRSKLADILEGEIYV